jgi:hypothetical protein
MNERRFTKGPWKVSFKNHNDGDQESGGPSIITDGVDPWYIARIENGSPDQQANARLIAAAPDLLEALCVCERLIDGPIADLLTGDSMNDTGAYDTLSIARTAIAKALKG